MTGTFSYAEFTTRNIGFISQDEQLRMKRGVVFVCGTGGMGGAALLSLVRAGVGHVIIADIDTFEISNLNRQVFAFTDTVGQPKAEAAGEAVRRINPEIILEVLDQSWPSQIERIVGLPTSSSTAPTIWRRASCFTGPDAPTAFQLSTLTPLPCRRCMSRAPVRRPLRNVWATPRSAKTGMT